MVIDFGFGVKVEEVEVKPHGLTPYNDYKIVEDNK